jgi:transcriptional regulator with XRE-family HTH domain
MVRTSQRSPKAATVPNERLRDAMQSAHITPTELAEELGVDPKTVERWITKSREPYPKHRHAVAARLGERERYLWPFALSGAKAEQVNESELVKFYSHRGAVPSDLWDHLLEQASAATQSPPRSITQSRISASSSTCQA